MLDLEDDAQQECFFCGEYHDQELWGDECPYMGADALFGILDLL